MSQGTLFNTSGRADWSDRVALVPIAEALPSEWAKFPEDLKAAMPIDSLHGSTLEDYGSMCAAILAQSHGRNGDPAMIAGYRGRSARFDDAIAEFALVYSEQVGRDHEAIVVAVRTGRLQSAAEDER